MAAPYYSGAILRIHCFDFAGFNFAAFAGFVDSPSGSKG